MKVFRCISFSPLIAVFLGIAAAPAEAMIEMGDDEPAETFQCAE